MLVSPVFAGWVKTDQVGEWEIVSDTYWESGDGDELKHFTYEYDPVDITASWSFAVYSYVYVQGLEWWQYVFGSNTVKQNIVFSMVKGSDEVRIRLEHKAVRTWATLGLSSFNLWIYKKVGGDWEKIFHAQNIPVEVWKKQEYAFRFYFFKQSDTVCRFVLVALTDRDSDMRVGDEVVVDFSVSAEFWTDLRLEQYVEKSGKGNVKGWKDGESFSKNETSETEADTNYWLWNIFRALTTPLYDVLPDWLQDFVDVMTGFFSPVYDLLVSGWSIALGLIPFLPIVFICWLVDAGVASVSEGSFRPIGYCWSTILNTVQVAGQWIVAIAHALYDVITFW